MGDCLSGPKVAGLEDEDKPESELITVLLSTGMEVPVWVVPTNTMKTIDGKIVQVYGKQPRVSMDGQMVDPFLNAKEGKKWVPVQWDATIEDVSVKVLKYSDISDKIKLINNLTHAHWALSNAPANINNLQAAFEI